MSYGNGALACINKRLTLVIEFDDVDLVVFENVNYSSRNAF